MAGLDETTRTADRGVGEQFSASATFDGSIFAIELFGELDMAAVPELERTIARAEETSAVTILVDLSALQFIDSSGIRMLLEASKRSGAGTDRIRFLRGTGQVERTLVLCGLHGRLPFVD